MQTGVVIGEPPLGLELTVQQPVLRLASQWPAQLFPGQRGFKRQIRRQGIETRLELGGLRPLQIQLTTQIGQRTIHLQRCPTPLQLFFQPVDLRYPLQGHPHRIVGDELHLALQCQIAHGMGDLQRLDAQICPLEAPLQAQIEESGIKTTLVITPLVYRKLLHAQIEGQEDRGQRLDLLTDTLFVKRLGQRLRLRLRRPLRGMVGVLGRHRRGYQLDIHIGGLAREQTQLRALPTGGGLQLTDSHLDIRGQHGKLLYPQCFQLQIQRQVDERIDG